jgi:hypothetical protein
VDHHRNSVGRDPNVELDRIGTHCDGLGK